MYSFGNCTYILLTFFEDQQTKERWAGGGEERKGHIPDSLDKRLPIKVIDLSSSRQAFKTII